MLAGEPTAIAGFIDHGGPGPLDEVLVELANGEERIVRRDELTSMCDVIRGHWRTREVYLAGGRHSPTGFGLGGMAAPDRHSSRWRSCSGRPTARPRSRTTKRSSGT